MKQHRCKTGEQAKRKVAASCTSAYTRKVYLIARLDTRLKSKYRERASARWGEKSARVKGESRPGLLVKTLRYGLDLCLRITDEA